MDRTSRFPFCRLTSTKHVTNKEHLAKTLDEKKSFASRTVEAFDMEGRISMDLMMAVEREHNLDTYKLDNIAKVILGKSKLDVSPQDMFKAYREYKTATSSAAASVGEKKRGGRGGGRYYDDDDDDRGRGGGGCCYYNDKEACADDFDIMDFEEDADSAAAAGLGNSCQTERAKKMKIAKQTIEDEKREAKLRGVKTMKKVSDYCLVDSELVLDILEKNNIWVTSMVYGRIFGITPYSVFAKGQQFSCLSMVYNVSAARNLVVNCSGRGGGGSISEEESESYKGGAVATPVPGVHNLVIVMDFCSLYPSIMRSFNVCYTTYVPESKWHMYREDQMYSIEVERDEEDDEGHGNREASSSSYSSSSATSFIQKGECHKRKAAGVKPKPRKQLKLSKYAKEGSSYRGRRERGTRKRRTTGDDDVDDDDGEGQVGENAKVVKFLKSPE